MRYHTDEAIVIIAVILCNKLNSLVVHVNTEYPDYLIIKVS